MKYKVGDVLVETSYPEEFYQIVSIDYDAEKYIIIGLTKNCGDYFNKLTPVPIKPIDADINIITSLIYNSPLYQALE
jgi:hypothetical protein